MSLPILVAIVVVGIAAVVAAVHLTGGSARASLSGTNQALQRFATDYPEVTAKAVFLTEDTTAALLLLDDGTVGIVSSIGDKYLTRIVAKADIEALGAPDDRTVSLRLRDFTWKGGKFQFPTSEAAAAVMAAFSGYSGATVAKEKV